MKKRRIFWYNLFLSFIISGLILAGCAEDEPTPTAQPEPTAVVEEPPPAEPEPTEAPAETEEPPPAEPEEPAVAFENLHVPSPEWQDQIIYFLMTDRFADGDPDNNDMGAGEYDPADFSPAGKQPMVGPASAVWRLPWLLG